MSDQQQGQQSQQQAGQTQSGITAERVTAHEPSSEQTRLVTLFDEMESKQLEFIDDSGKAMIERVIALLGVLFVVSAFSNNFPPAYLKGNVTAKVLVIITLILYILSLWMSMLATQPRRYQRSRYDLEKMRQTLDAIFTYKIRWLRWARWLFALGSVALALLIISVIWGV
jgi:hypothetical protein